MENSTAVPFQRGSLERNILVKTSILHESLTELFSVEPYKGIKENKVLPTSTPANCKLLKSWGCI